MTPRRLTRIAACGLAVIALGGMSACSKKEPGVDEPAREGLAVDVAGVEYTVFITRELNLGIPPDKGLYNGKPAAPGHNLYGVFIKACNVGKKTRQTVADFRVEDNQGNEFEPIEVEDENAFAYRPRKLPAGECIPEDGSIGQLGPTAASVLLFEFSLQTTENRPLELDVLGPYDYAKGTRESKQIELDL